MIRQISIEGFKSLKKVDLELGTLNIFIGTNASGKSNFFDALRVLQGIGYGFTIDEIFNGKPKSATSEVWDGIRGGSAKAGYVEKGEHDSSGSQSLRFAVTIQLPETASPIEYSVTLSIQGRYIQRERMVVGTEEVFSIEENEEGKSPTVIGPALEYRKTGQTTILQQVNPYQSMLHQVLRNGSLSPTNLRLIEACIHALSNVQNFDPIPAVLRRYASTRHVTRMGDHGEDFAALVSLIETNKANKSAYLSWLRQLTPVEFDDVKTLKGALNEPLFAVMENGVHFPAPILSDGTLRFAAIAATLFQPDMPSRLMIEEIENGLHPSRLRLLVELLKSQAMSDDLQVIVTTHSPALLSWLDEKDYGTTFLCRGNEETGASEIVPLSAIPRFIELARKQPVGDLLIEGWLEAAL